MPKPFAAAVLAVLLASCATKPAAQQEPSPDVVKHNATPADLAALKIPVLRSAWAEKNWGKPDDIQIRTDGGYMLRYRKGTSLNFLSIEGSPVAKTNPASPPSWQEEVYVGEGNPSGGPSVVDHPQNWRVTTLLGKTVEWYQNDGGGGADFPQYRTVYFPATAPDGRTGWYRLRVDADSAANAAKWIDKAGW